MGDDDDFNPFLGRQGGAGRPRSFVGQVIVAGGLQTGRRNGVSASRTGSGRGARTRRFDGSRIGRGAVAGRLLASRRAGDPLRARRVVVKTSLTRLSGKGLGAARAHLSYIQRDGVTREGDPGDLYSARGDRVDGREFLERSCPDRHQFRFIVSAEDGDRYEDLKPLVRRLMAQVERDLETDLDWVAVDHFNTGHPHTHIVVRGVDDRGRNLVIAPEYLKHGIRARAVEVVTRDLGVRLDSEIEARLRHEVTQERLTPLDRGLIARMGADRIVAPSARKPEIAALEAGRLQTLERMELAAPSGAGSWQLAEGIEQTLREMGERGDIIRTMQRALGAARLDRAEVCIHGPDLEVAPNLAHGREGGAVIGPLVGRVVARGLADEHRDRHYLVLDGVDGRSHYFDIGRGDAVAALPAGAIVRASRRELEIRAVDRTVAGVAAASGGRYSAHLHLTHDPATGTAFAETHVRRLEALRRAGVPLTREDDGTWHIRPDHLAHVEAHEIAQLRQRPMTIDVLATGPLVALSRADAATWLDRELVEGGQSPIRDAGFGHELRGALRDRRDWLLTRDLAVREKDGVRLRPGALETLRRRELIRIGGELGVELAKPFVEARNGDRVEGKLTRRIDAISGPYAVLEKSHEFTLVPWRPVLEKQMGQQAGGIMRAAGISWQFGRGRQGPEIGF
ncbi:relaxase/mobilization nuclease RlxS [Novosphingobium resinovorum]|uniref:Conjugal transfer protein TraI n=1 Tax=Novosphingobium resinovorum TaxID=158500 RepID=A0A1D8A2P1_9SPHN|nr:relaxase/mobilization nuclease RlxS [Novosphingobium resinovorum]AOR76374.1 conjugal transfer protein TraI [Novosphingobium resinovorum]